MTMPTAQEILSLYLYGQKTPPADLKTDALIRPTGPGATPAFVDINEYMTTGGGRFVKVQNFGYVRNFLAGTDYPGKKLAAGTYTRDQLLAAYGIGGTLAIQQYYLGLGDADFIDRAYVFGTGGFEINADAKFYVNADGSREIADIAVIPQEDNFDFESTSWAAKVTNWLTKDRIDPSGIGRQVPIIFTGTISNKQVLTGEDWYALDIANKLSELGKLLEKAVAPTAVLDFAALMVQFAAAGIIDYKDAEGRFVYYDGVSPTNNGTLNGADGLAKVQYRGALYGGAVALIGGGGNDQLNATDKNDELYGGSGADTLNAAAGNDLLDGGTENDSLYGGAGNDTLLGGGGDDWLDGGEDDDQLFGGDGADTLRGGTGNDTLVGGLLADSLEGGEGNDLIGGDEGNDTLLGGAGNDSLAGGADKDSLDGGNGDDFLTGDAGDDTLAGGIGKDTMYGGSGNDSLDGSFDADLLLGEDGNDTLLGSFGDDSLHGGTGDDSLDGGFDNDLMIGGDGRDTLDGGFGNDVLQGGVGDDQLIGSDGDDVLWGSGLAFEQDGNDTLRGGAGYDVYHASGGDIIVDDDGVGLVRMRQRILDGAWRLKGEQSYHSWDNQYTFDWNGSTLTISGNGDGVLTIQNFSNGRLDIFLSETDKELPRKPPFDPNRTRARVDPLVLDLNHDGVIQSVGLSESNVFFDFNKDAIAEKSGWVGPQDGILVNDLNGNGVVDDLGELFGNATEDGFSSLKRQFDSDGNGVIDKFDQGFGKLLVWQDQNLDGISQAGELKSLDSLHIESIQTASTKVSVNSKDNVIIGTSTFVQDGQTQLAADMELAVDYALTDSNPSRPLGDAASLSDDVALLPKLRGFGVVKDLAYACQDDPKLKAYVQGLLAGGRPAVEAGFDALVAKWTGLEAAYAKRGMTWGGYLRIEDKLWILESLSGVDVSKTLIENNNFSLSTVNSQNRMRFSETYINERFSTISLRMELSFSTQAFDKPWLKGVFYSVDQDRFDAFAPAVLNDSLAVKLPTLTGYDETVAVARLVARLRADGVALDIARLDSIAGAMTYSEPVHFALTGNFNLGTAQADYIEGQTGQRNWLDGAQGNDVLISFTNDDLLHGGLGNDTLQGGGGSDVYAFDAGDGADTIIDADYASQKGMDMIRLGAGIRAQDTTARRVQDDLVLSFGNAGSIRVSNYFYADANDGTYAIEQIAFTDGAVWDIIKIKQLVMVPTADSEALTGYATNDSIEGLAGDDRIAGRGGNDTLRGGTGNDVVDGGDGDDVFYFEGGDGRDLLLDASSSATGDALKLGAAFSAADTSAKRVGRDLLLTFAGNSTDQVMVADYFATGDHQIERIEFKDGTVWTVPMVRQMVLRATTGDDALYADGDTQSVDGLAGNDSLYGSASANVLTGGRGNDSLEGGRGSDIYVFARGDGNDTIYDHDEWQHAGDIDTLRLGVDIAAAETRATRIGADLVLNFGRGDSVLVKSYFEYDAVGATQVERVEFNDGTVWDVATVKDMVQRGTEQADQLIGYASNDSLSGLGGDDVLSGGAGDDTLRGGAGQDALNGDAGNDTLEGGAGNDFLSGGIGNNSYLFGRGDGQDVISTGYDSATDRINALVLGANITKADALLRQVNGVDLEFSIAGTQDKITARNFFAAGDVGSGYNPLQKIVFADGSSWDAEAVKAAIYAGSPGNDNIIGGKSDDAIRGLAGNDTLDGSAGNDTLDGGDGSDQLFGSDGNDLLLGGAGADSLSGASGNDLLDAGSGDDDLSGDQGDDVLLGGEGADALRGGDGGDLMDGGAGNDRLNGGTGNNVYRFGREDGQDTVESLYFGAADRANVLQFKAGILPSDIALRQVGAADLEVSIAGTSDKVLIKDFLVGDDLHNNQSAVQAIQFSDASVWDLEGIKAKLFAGSSGDDLIRGTKLNDLIQGGQGQDSLAGAAGDDTLIGGAGDDTLDGGLGNDQYQFGRGDGQDTIAAVYDATTGKSNVLVFKSNVAVQDVQLRQVDTGLELSIRGTTDRITALEFFAGDDAANPNNGLQQVRFADGTVWTIDTLLARLYAGTDAADSLRGTLYDDVIRGGLGQDALNGAEGNDSLYGDDGDDTLNGGAGLDYLAGGSGSDVYLVDASSDVVFELEDTGVDTVLSTADTYTLPSNVENLVLDQIGGYGAGIAGRGNELNNTLTGNWADNRLEGGEGVDTLIGGTGDDTYVVDTTNDQIVELDSEGLDTVESSVSYSLATLPTVENITLTGTANLQATGNDVGNLLRGNAGNNTLDGGLGSDQLEGGAGDDVYIVESVRDWNSGTGDVVIEQAGEGADTVVRSFDTLLILEDNVENLTLVGDVTHGNGNELDNVITGNAADNSLLGLEGNDTLLGGAGNDALFGDVGVDSMIGGAGDDYYAIDDAGDTITELANEGDDFVRSTVSWTLGANLERLAVDGSENLTVTGNALDNGLWGNDGANLITGGKGNDYLSGGAGNDTYVFNKGDGQDSIDTVDVSAAVDTLRIGALDSEVLGFKSGSSLFLKIKNSTDQIAFIDYYAGATVANGVSSDHKIDRVEFSNGVVWDQVMLQSVVDRALNNKAPVISGSVPTLNAKQGSQFSYTIPANLVTDPDPWDSITYSVSMSDQSPVPAWLSFDPATRVLSGIPGAANVGTLSFVVWGTDNYNYSTGLFVTLKVGAPNKAPVLAQALPDQAVNEGVAFSYTVAATAFTDPDAGDTLSYNVTLADGSALPAWLSFNAGTRVFSGTPPTGSAGKVSVLVTAKDPGNLSASDIFDLNITLASVNKTGTTGADSLAGSVGNDTLSGLGGNDTLTGLAGNDLLDGGAGTDSMIGGAGDDTYVVDSSLDVVTELAGEGRDTVQSSVTLTLAANVENLTLIGTTAINGTGNSLDNLIVGNSAVNTLDGGAGADTLQGGAGNDIYVVDNAADVVIENAAEGADLVNSSVTTTLAGNVENLTLTGTAAINGTGNALDNLLAGNSGVNTLTGAAGNDTLDGGAGADSLVGGAGNDSYLVDNTADVIVENAAEGTDLVSTSVTFTLAANVENLTLTGATAINGTGNDSDNVLIGNSAANTLTGAVGNDTLDGGAGADKLIGGLGNDSYVVDNASDAITENASEGADTVTSSLTWTLGTNLENLVLSGTTAINGTGNTADNQLTGNSAANTLTGGAGNDTLNGGAGTDSLVGGAGNDVYFVDVSADVIVENAAEGTDTVNSAVAWTLGTNLENLTLTGTAAINGTGNASDNVITGNSAANTLTGAAGNDTLDGGAGNDSLVGGAGADIYVFGRGYGADTLTENDTTAGIKDAVTLGAGIVKADLKFTQSGNNLVASIIGTTDALTLTNWYLGSQYHVEEFRFTDGTVVTDTQAQALVTAMAAFAPGASVASDLQSGADRASRIHHQMLAVSGATS